MRTLIKNGILVDPSQNLFEAADLLIEDGRIKEFGKCLDVGAEDVIDAAGCHVYPGFIDMHAHLREPGFEYKETVATGTASAAAGGFTTVCAMPNTRPVIDTGERVRAFLDIVKKDAVVRVLPIGAVTLGQEGRELADISALKEAGVCGISEDGKSVMDIDLYRKAMKQAADLDVMVMAHCEDRELLRGGVINEGIASKRLGLPGIANIVEDHITIRDILLSGESGTRLHICHCSTEMGVEFIRLAKKKGFRVTAEVCPHHFSLSDSDICEDDGNYKMNPPLRSPKDVEALKEGLRDGTIDVISTDHAPHGEEEKQRGFTGSPFGIVGFETAYALGVTNLVKQDVLDIFGLIQKMSTNPAKLLGLDRLDGRGTLRHGAVADIAIADPDEKWVVDASAFKSKGKNTPFDREFLYGRIKHTLVNGRITGE